jgi:hypothetical protein
VIELSKAGGEPRVYETMDLQIWKQRREEMMREVEQNRLAKALRDSHKRRGSGRVSALAWELNRAAGRLRKILRTSRKVG